MDDSRNDRYIDETVRPGDDFYRYAYGKWLDDSNLLSPSNEVDKAFSAFEAEVYEKTDDPVATVLRKLLEDAKAAFQQKQQQLRTLWEQLEAYPGQPADGEATLRENMADLGGMAGGAGDGGIMIVSER